MRILLALAVVVVFAALMVFDTTALVRLTVVCVTGGCGVPTAWFAVAGGMLVLTVLLSFRRPGATVKKAPVRKAPASKAPGRKAGRPRPARGKATARSKPKPAK
jgi:hypothetical protein